MSGQFEQGGIRRVCFEISKAFFVEKLLSFFHQNGIGQETCRKNVKGFIFTLELTNH